ncbi:MAG: c-type cytochrome [Gammaproteobacteria bacterium]|nr:c-type cytochrome [Gammaproteobacteria bacterium]MBT8111247.1 c-type cytochrome [Gammaproteobacteria bacterium]NND48601.1 cytochrome c5 family protein [Woeseiaceae bacterium]NNL45945.1 cytochrome c5 family protein [Woeseiaceae bacterium]
MKGIILLTASGLVLAACAHDASNDSAGTFAASSGNRFTAMNGESAYQQHCAGCHETGMLGSPIAGDAADWGDRSQLWDAVLLDHAITGYLEMPARGGKTELPDDVIRSAVDYMLRMTFPDMPHDCNPPYCANSDE